MQFFRTIPLIQFSKRFGVIPNGCKYYFVAACSISIALLSAVSANGFEDDGDEIRRGMAAVFSEPDVCELNGSLVCRRAAVLPPHERYGYLVNWVLPVKSPSLIRLGIDFTQTDPVPKLVTSVDTFMPGASRVHDGGIMVSPALDLVRTAATLGRLDELQQRCETKDAENLLGKQCRTALLIAIAVEQQNAVLVAQHVGSLLDTEKSEAIDGRLKPWFLFSLHCLMNSSLVDQATVQEMPGLLERVKDSRARNVETQHLKAVINLILMMAERATAEPRSVASWKPKQWHPVNRFNAKSRGTGVSPSLWNLRLGHAQNVVSHGHDLLYFAVPMQRDFTIEGDVSVFRGRDVEFQVAGRWYAPSFTLGKYSTGNIRGARQYRKLPSKMSKATDSVRHQSVVRDGRLTTAFNGRIVDSVAVADNHDPWVAIHSEQHYEGVARNILIGGAPVIPRSLQLVADDKQSGWVTYFGSSIGGPNAQWRPSKDPKLMRLIGTHRPELQGTDYEELIYYHRPLLEDGTVEVEFFYRENEITVHPAMDRMCFLLDPGGVKLHWLTDGVYDRTELSSGNAVNELEFRRGPAALPLNEGKWNTLRLELVGDTVSLILNGIKVYERDLQVTNQRTFGLFHFADQTEARVRSVVYSGNWPQKIPDVTQQELANPVLQELEEHLAALPATFDHDFSNNLPKQAFHSPGVDSEDYIKITDNGVHVVRPGIDDDQWYDSILVPNCELHGDFDINIRFRDLKASYSPGGYGSVGLRLSFDDEFSSWYTWLRRVEPTKARDEKNFMHLMASQRREGKTFHEYFDCGSAEFLTGGLRVARKGETLYLMIAEQDSPFFHLLKTFPVGRAPILPVGLRFLTSSHKAGETHVTWQKLSLRAEKITGLAMKKVVHDVSALNEQQDKLAVLFDTDFAKRDDVVSTFLELPGQGTFNFEEGGLRVVAPGAKEWTSTTLMAREPLRGDFDVELQFDEVKFQRPPPERESTVYLSMEFHGRGLPEIHCKYAIAPDGNRAAESQRRIRRQDGTFAYKEQSVKKTDRLSGLRIARRGDVAYLLFRRGADDAWELLEMIPVGTQDVPARGLQVKLHSGGEDQQMEALLKRVTVRCAKRSVTPLEYLRGLID